MEALYQFTYASEHVEIFKRKKEWFHKMTAMHMAFWYVQENHRPTVEEAKKRLAYLQKHGETKLPMLLHLKVNLRQKTQKTLWRKTR